jgi:hypothetical protein
MKASFMCDPGDRVVPNAGIMGIVIRGGLVSPGARSRLTFRMSRTSCYHLFSAIAKWNSFIKRTFDSVRFRNGSLV